MQSLSGKVAVITGASSGIGEATAMRLANAGCMLQLAARSEDKVEALARRIGDAAHSCRTDVQSSEEVAQLVELTLSRFGRIDILVANAGIYSSGEILGGNSDDWDRTIDTNLRGVVQCASAVLPAMTMAGGGDIIVTSSISGFVEGWNEPVYGATKHAVNAFSHILRRQVAQHGVRVGVIAPGRVANDLWGYSPDDAAALVAAKEALESDDVAAAVEFMLSQPAHVTIRDLVLVPHNANV